MHDSTSHDLHPVWFFLGFILNERSTLHCEIKRFVITLLEVSKGEKLGRITCGHVDMNFAQKTLWKAQITSLCRRYHRLSDWTDVRVISKDFLTAVLIGCLPNDQSATIFAKSCNWKFLFSPFQIARFYLSFCSVLSYIKPLKSSRMRTHRANLMAKYSCSLLREKLNYLVQSDENTTSRRPSPSNKENGDGGLDLPAIYNPLMEYVTFLSHNTTFYIADEVQAIQMKYLIHFKLLLWVLKFCILNKINYFSLQSLCQEIKKRVLPLFWTCSQRKNRKRQALICLCKT